MIGSMVPAWGPLFSFVLYAPLDFQISIVRGECHSFFQLCFYLFFFGSPYRFAPSQLCLFNRLCEINPAAEDE